MPTIKITPYEIIEDLIYQAEAIIDINEADIIGVVHNDSQMMFSFFGCRFEKLKIVNSTQLNIIEVSFYFHGCVIEEIKIESIESDNITLHFASCLLSGTIRSKRIKSVNLNNCFIDSLFLVSQKEISISYTEENIFVRTWRKIMLISQITSIHELIVRRQYYYISESAKVSFRMNEAKDKKGGMYGQLYQLERDFRIGYYLTKAQKQLINISIDIIYSPIIETATTNISNCFLHNLSLSGTVTGKLLIENVQIDNWYVHELTLKEEAIFYLISPSATKRIEQGSSSSKLVYEQKKVEIHKSNLDKAWFDNFNFNQYDLISFYRTRIGKAIFTGCEFPEDFKSFNKFKILENIHYPETLQDNFYKNQYEVFLQLKSTLESTGNIYEAQKMQSIASEALRNVKQLSTSDKIILILNSWSNNHGISIRNPLLWFLGTSIILYIFYLWSLGRIFNHNAINYKLIGYYFSFIDITHRPDFLDSKADLTGWSLVIDYTGKVLSSFLIYQFIAAFRKYGKK